MSLITIVQESALQTTAQGGAFDPESTQQLFANTFTGDAARALAPMVSLTVGILVLLVCELFEGLKKIRPAVFLGAILASAWGCWGLWQHTPEIGAPVRVLGGTLLVSQQVGVWGMVFLAATLVAWMQARKYYRQEAPFLGEHDVLMLTAPIGMMMMAGAQDLITFFIGLELLSIPLYCLAAFRRVRNDSVEAGLKYFVLGAFGVAMFLYGAGLLYTATGTMSLPELRQVGEALETPLARTGIALMLGSLFFKASIFPFHLWVPDVYQGSPTPVTSLMATGTKAAAIAFLLEASFLVPVSAATLIGILAVLTLAVGNFGALMQKDLKRMLAWSGIAHAGTLLFTVAASAASDGLLSAEATQAAVLYMAAYVFTAGGAFALLSWLEADGEHHTTIDGLRGLGQRRPGMAAGMTLFLLSLGGIPATGGFIGKFFVFGAAVQADMIALSIAGILLSVVALGYYLRVVIAMWMQPAKDGQAPPMAERPWAAACVGFCAAMVVAIGVLPGFLSGSTLFP
tara:strand:+ start:10862 stop:12403 length:1542 start_codon:yes stop_codon:yes gene_type:complete